MQKYRANAHCFLALSSAKVLRHAYVFFSAHAGSGFKCSLRHCVSADVNVRYKVHLPSVCHKLFLFVFFSEHFLLDLQIKVIAKNVEKSADGNQKVYEVMRDYIQKKYDKTGSPFDVRSTDTPVYHLLDYIKTIEKCHIVDISLTDQSSTDIQINCLSSVAMEDFLKSINRNEFEQELFKLRRWLYVQYDVESHVIIANCSSNGIEKANKRLRKLNIDIDYILYM
jgi:hypothetical protein